MQAPNKLWLLPAEENATESGVIESDVLRYRNSLPFETSRVTRAYLTAGIARQKYGNGQHGDHVQDHDTAACSSARQRTHVCGDTEPPEHALTLVNDAVKIHDGPHTRTTFVAAGH